jgi:protein-tyrosine phosphatase
MIKTSDHHPIRIDAIDAGAGRGRIGVTFAPGKHDSGAASGYWERDLAKDLDAIANWKANAVVTLIEPHEMDLLGIPNLGDEVRRRGMDWLHLPIRDVGTPSAAFEADWPQHSRRLRDLLDNGQNILVHCRGGLVRAGMISALAAGGVRGRTGRGYDSGSRRAAWGDRDAATGSVGRDRSNRPNAKE